VISEFTPGDRRDDVERVVATAVGGEVKRRCCGQWHVNSAAGVVSPPSPIHRLHVSLLCANATSNSSIRIRSAPPPPPQAAAAAAASLRLLSGRPLVCVRARYRAFALGQ